MLQLRPEQLAAFERVEMDKFIARARRNIREFWAEESEQQDDASLDQLITRSVARCRELDADGEEDILIYINHMYALGEDFENDSLFPWVSEILQDASMDGSARMEALAERTEMELSS